MSAVVPRAPPERPALLFAPGAGAASSSAWMRAWRDRLATIGDVEAFDYPYRLAGRRAPDKLPILIAAHRKALDDLRAHQPTATGVVLVGKSMGGRVGCHVAVTEADLRPIDAVVCLGYPLRSPAGALRDEVLLAMRTPVLFVQGTRDPLCPLDLLTGVRERMTAPNELLIVAGGNHSLEVPKRGGGQAATDETVLQAIRDFVTRTLGDQERRANT